MRRTGRSLLCKAGEEKVFHRREQWAVNRQIIEARWGRTGGRKLEQERPSRANLNMRPARPSDRDQAAWEVESLAFERKRK